MFERIFNRKLWRGYQEYLERHDAYYPAREPLTFRGFKYWHNQWEQNYQRAWDAIYKWQDQHQGSLDFQSAPDFRTVQQLEEKLCV